MAECPKLDTVMSDRKKGDFIWSISHELRSPLHGILASTEFLSDTTMDAFLSSLIETVDACGRTLLDTINHVLDYSKINAFERTWRNSKHNKARSSRGGSRRGTEVENRAMPRGAPPLLQLSAETDIAAITEEVIDCIAIGQIYNHAAGITDVSAEARGQGAGKGLINDRHVLHREDGTDHVEPVDVVLDFDSEDWVFVKQAGALRRVIMNLFGNAVKYTTTGTIKVRLQLVRHDDADKNSETLVLTISDTGKGISEDFLSSKLFVPFAQVSK